MLKDHWYEGEFVKIETEAPDVLRMYIQLQLPPNEPFSFEAGQFMTFDLPIHEKKQKRWRSYSIASAPNSTGLLEFVIVRLDGGAGTKYLFDEIKVGSTIKLRGALGNFTLPQTELQQAPEICFICTGTGIAPFRSMLYNMVNHQLPHPPMHLIFGTRTEPALLYRTEMEQLQSKLNFKYYPTLSRAQGTDWQGHTGYVHNIYEQIFADRRPAVFYLCGWRNMIDEARQRLAQMGYTKKQIIFELYG